MTDEQIIVKLGDTRKVAEFCEVPLARVSKWKQRGIPYRDRITIARMAACRSVDLPAMFLVEQRKRAV